MASAAADVTEEVKAWWLRFNNGVAVDDEEDEALLLAETQAEICEGNYEQLQRGLPRRKRKAIAMCSKLHVDGAEVQKDVAQSKWANWVHMLNENLRLQIALKTKELEHEEKQRLKLELILKAKEIESLQKQNEQLKAENEKLKQTAKPPRVKRLCRSCGSYEFHDYLNCPNRRQAAAWPSDEEEED